MKYFILMIAFLLCTIESSFANNEYSSYGGNLTLRSRFTNDESDLRLVTDIYELAFWYESNSAVIYSMIEDEKIELQEVHVDFSFVGLDWKVGKVVVPFGFDYLERGTNTVFITVPRITLYEYGLHLGLGNDIIRLDGTINGNNDYTLRFNIAPFNLDRGGLVFSTSYANHEKINDEFGTWSLTGKLLQSILSFNLSVVTEYMPNVNGYWIRTVTSPSIFDFVGFMGGYYNLANIGHEIDNYTYKPAWTYGLYVDISKDVILSTEWKFGEEFPSPYNIKLSTSLTF